MDLNIFEKATRQQLRFPSPIGDLDVESLWHFPLLAKGDKVDLDTIARAISAELRDVGDGGFVKTDKPDPRVEALTTKLEVLKRIIEVKEAEKAAAETAILKADQKRRLLAVLASKKEAELAGQSVEEIQRQIDALGI